jgi:hypothetical protein
LLFDDLVTVGDLADSDFPRHAQELWAPILEVTREDVV